MAKILGVSTKKYQRVVVTQERSLEDDVILFIKLAETLGIDPIELVNHDNDNRHLISSIKIKRFSSEDEFNSFLLKFEKENGRTAIFNMFPSTIYYRNSTASNKRYELLSGNPDKNVEFYSVCAILDFCFNVSFNPYCSFSREEKIGILGKIIQSFSKDENDKHKHGHFLKQLHIFDPNVIGYFHDSPTCTYFKKKGLVLIPSLTNRHELIVIRSIEFAEKIDSYMKESDSKILQTKESVKFLRNIKTCLENNKNIYQFVEELKINNNEYAKYIFNSLPKCLIDT